MKFATIQFGFRQFKFFHFLCLLFLCCFLYFSTQSQLSSIRSKNSHSFRVEMTWLDRLHGVMKDTFASASYLLSQSESPVKINCIAHVPCVYEEELDLRLIVITHNRKNSVMKLLYSLQDLELDGDKAALEIWVDPKADGSVHSETFEAVSSFKWAKGPTRVHIQTAHVGIMGQWIDTWRPKNAPSFSKDPEKVSKYPFDAKDYKEIALILEDDLNISSHAYRWLKGAYKKYNGRPDFAGVSLQSDEIHAHNTIKHLAAPRNQSAFMNICIGTWGFAPASKMWAEFQDWFHQVRTSPNSSQFHPYVPVASTFMSWFKIFEGRGTQESMWEMWFVYFTNFKKAFSVFSNLEAVNGNKESCLCINRREVGLHYYSKGSENLCKLLARWNASYVDMLPDKPIKFDWNGNIVQ